MRKACILTGTRAEYGLLNPVMKAINRHPQLKLQVLVTGMHLEKQYGFTINEIIKDGFKINARVKLSPKSDKGSDVAKAIGSAIIKMAAALERLNPDFLLVLGDRFEPLAGVIAAAYMNIPIAHIHGGDSAKAGLDEPVRHSITKFAALHFVASKKSYERVIGMGEDKWRTFNTGAPSLDTILHSPSASRQDIERYIRLKLPKRYILMIQHPVSTEPKKARTQIKETLAAIKHLKIPTMIIYPNSDSGGRVIIREIKKIENLNYIKTFISLPHKIYLGLMKNCSVMIGNSSSGIIESSSFKIPVVNIGIRQEGRERTDNVIDCDHKKSEITKSIKKAISPKFQEKLKNIKNPYGNGTSGKRIAHILSQIKINDKLIQKKLTY